MTKNNSIFWKNEKWWIIAIVVLSTVLVGVATDFRWEVVKLIQADPSYHLNPVRAVLYLSVFLYFLKGIYQLTEMINKQVPILCFVFVLAAPIIFLLLLFLLYDRSLVVSPEDAVKIARNQMFLLGMTMSCLLAIEVRAMLVVIRMLKDKARIGQGSMK